MQKVQSSKMKLQQITNPTKNFGLFHLLLISWFWAFHLLILLCQFVVINADIITGNDGGGLEQAALMQSFDADGISLDPCQLQNSSNTGQFSLVTSLTVVAQCDEMFVPVLAAFLKLIEWQNENFCSEFSRW